MPPTPLVTVTEEEGSRIDFGHVKNGLWLE